MALAIQYSLHIFDSKIYLRRKIVNICNIKRLHFHSDNAIDISVDMSHQTQILLQLHNAMLIQTFCPLYF